MSTDSKSRIVPHCPEIAEGQLVSVPLHAHSLSQNIILPKWVYILDRNGRYLTIRSGPQYATLTFRTGAPDADCIFEATRTSNLWYRFIGNAGGHIMRYYSDPGWYSSDGTTTPSFNVIIANENVVYLRDSYSPSRFLSDELRPTGAPLGHDYINESSRMEIVQAATRNQISEVQYNIQQATVKEVPPVVVLTASVRNASDVPATHTITSTYQRWAVGTWNNTAGIELGARPSFTAGVPFVANAEFEISITSPSLRTWGGEEGVRETVASSKAITIPARKAGTITVVLRNAQIDVPFTYKQRINWANGQVDDSVKNGIYNNVDTWAVDAELELEDI